MGWLAFLALLVLLGWATLASSLLSWQGAKLCPGQGGEHHLVSRQEKVERRPLAPCARDSGDRKSTRLNSSH